MGRNNKNFLSVILFFSLIGFLLSGCTEEKDKEYPKKVPGGYLDRVDEYSIMSKNINNLSRKRTFINPNYNFILDTSKKYFVFSKGEKGDILRFYLTFNNSYFFILSPRGIFGSQMLKNSTKEFPGWNTRVSFDESEDNVIVYVTFLIFTQNDTEIKEIISDYKKKPIKRIKIDGYQIPPGPEREPGFYSSEVEGDEVTQEIAEHLFNYLLSLSYSNENYERVIYSKNTLGRAYEEETIETKYVEFEDGSTFEVHIDSYSDLETGTITMQEGTFVFAR